MKRVFLMGIVFQLPFCLKSKVDQSDSEVMLEVDDRETMATKDLVDVSAKVETYINEGIDAIRKDYKFNEKAIRADFKSFSQKVSKILSAPQDKTGIVIAGFTIVPYTKIEAWSLKTLDPKSNEIAKIPFSKSRYGVNPVGLISGRVVSHKLEVLANFTVGPVIRIHKTLIGVDKLSHFFEQGYWYFDGKLQPDERFAFGQYMEGDPAMPKEQYDKYAKIFRTYCSQCNRFGYYGSNASGVISFGDIAANESGFYFFKFLEKNPLGYKFKFNDYRFDRWNEVNSPSKYAHGVESIP